MGLPANALILATLAAARPVTDVARCQKNVLRHLAAAGNVEDEQWATLVCAPEHLPFILGIDESVTRWPPFTGGFEPHASVAGVRYSPGIAALPALPALGPPGRGLLLALLLGAGVLAARQRPRSAARPDA